MGNVIAKVTIVPLGTASTSLSAFVAAAVKTLKKFTGLNYQLTPMSTTLHIDDRRDKPVTIAGKLSLVEEKLKVL